MASIKSLISKSPKLMIRFMAALSEASWQKQSEEKVLKLFHEAANNIPAYKDFLINHETDIKSVVTIDDFRQRVPLMNKSTYLHAYSIDKVIGNDPSDNVAITHSSGSTGKPIYYFVPREEMAIFPQAFAAFFDYMWDLYSSKDRVLIINGMALGAWMGSTYANHVFQILSQKKDSRFTFITPGTDIERIIEIITTLGKLYSKIVITTYPSVIKTLIDYGETQHINWEEYNIRYASGGEMLTYELREYITNKLAPKEPLTTIFDSYGGTEIGNPGIGTPIAVLATKLALSKPELSEKFFGKGGVGNIFQCNPVSAYTESLNGKLIVTKAGALPVIRYDINDNGYYFGYKETLDIFKQHGIDLKEELKKAGWNKPIFQWPFVTVTGREDWAIAFFGTKIAPESILKIFAKDKRVRSFRFADKDSKNNPRFVINIELEPKVKMTKKQTNEFIAAYHDEILDYLLKSNFDFVQSYNADKKIVDPLLQLHAFSTGMFKDTLENKTKLL